MNLIKPKKLQQGDTITVIATSGDVDYDEILKAKEYFINKGYNVKLGKNIKNKFYYLAGSDEERLSDLHDAFLDKNVRAIICARGGYGALRLIEKIDYELIKNNPKIFCGYSDITILNAMILKNSGLITFSGPMAQSDFGKENIDTYTESEFFNNLTSNEIRIFPKNGKSYGITSLVEGTIWGGNLSSISSLCGIDFIPHEPFIFFAEDINEPAYKIDRYFTQLLNVKNFKDNVKAVLLGDFLGVDYKEFNSYIESLSSKFEIPIISGYPFSHSSHKTTVPYGAKTVLKDNIITIKDYLV